MFDRKKAYLEPCHAQPSVDSVHWSVEWFSKKKNLHSFHCLDGWMDERTLLVTRTRQA